MMSKGQTAALEFPFKTILYIVVAVVIIGFIITFRDQIIVFLKVCDLVPQACSSQSKCFTNEFTEKTLDQSTLEKYCDGCWEKGGRGTAKEDCLCFIVKGNYSPTVFTNENCELSCDKEAASLLVEYDYLFKKVYIKC
jgi:hypothetical protein